MTDPINPNHYQTTDGIQSIDVIEAIGADHHVGSAVKYLLRAGKKDGNTVAQEMNKAKWYLERGLMKKGSWPTSVLPSWMKRKKNSSRVSSMTKPQAIELLEQFDLTTMIKLVLTEILTGNLKLGLNTLNQIIRGER